MALKSKEILKAESSGTSYPSLMTDFQIVYRQMELPGLGPWARSTLHIKMVTLESDDINKCLCYYLHFFLKTELFFIFIFRSFLIEVLLIYNII